LANKISQAALLPIVTTIPLAAKSATKTTLGSFWSAKVVTTDEPRFAALTIYDIASLSRGATDLATTSLSGVTAA